MAKSDSMVKNNKFKSETKADKALSCMKQLFDDEQQVTVAALMKMTGFSRAYFYNNSRVHEEMIRLQELQEGNDYTFPQKTAIDKGMDHEIKLLQNRLREKDEEIACLRAEINKLQKIADAKLLSTIKLI